MKVRFNILFILLGLGMMSCEDDDDSSMQDILQRNRDVVTRLINEGLNNNNAAIALELAAPGFVDLDAFPNQPKVQKGYNITSMSSIALFLTLWWNLPWLPRGIL